MMQAHFSRKPFCIPAYNGLKSAKGQVKHEWYNCLQLLNQTYCFIIHLNILIKMIQTNGNAIQFGRGIIVIVLNKYTQFLIQSSFKNLFPSKRLLIYNTSVKQFGYQIRFGGLILQRSFMVFRICFYCSFHVSLSNTFLR